MNSWKHRLQSALWGVTPHGHRARLAGTALIFFSAMPAIVQADGVAGHAASQADLSTIKEQVCAVTGPLCVSLKQTYWSILGIANFKRWIPYLCAFGGAWLVYLLAGLRSGRTPLGALKWLYPSSIYLHRSAIVDYQFYLVLTLLGPLMALITVVLSAGFVGGWLASGLAALLGPPSTTATGAASGVMYAVLLFLAVDFSFYWAHRLTHTVPLLWEFHKVHHAAEVLTPVTAARLHPVDSIVSGTVLAVVVGTLNGIYSYLVYAGPGELDPVTLPGTATILLAFRIATIYEHTHVWVNWNRKLSHVLPAPALHIIHHSNEIRHRDKNMGRALGVWDWLFGTLYVPRYREKFDIGLSRNESVEYRTVGACLWLPFAKAASLIRARGVRAIVPVAPAPRKPPLSRPAELGNDG